MINVSSRGVRSSEMRTKSLSTFRKGIAILGFLALAQTPGNLSAQTTGPARVRKIDPPANSDRSKRQAPRPSTGSQTRPTSFPNQIDAAIEEGLRDFSSTIPIRKLLESQGSYSEQIRTAIEQAPLTLDSQVYDTYYFPDPVDSGNATRKKNAVTLKNTLTHSLRNSLTTKLTTTNSLDSYQAAGIETQQPYSLGLLVTYDWIQGGAEGASETTTKTSVKKIEQGTFTLRGQVLDTRIRYAGLWVDLFSAICKKQELKTAQDLVAQTLETGKIQLKARTISYKDFLNFNDLDNNFAKRRANIDSSIASLLEQIETFGDRSRELGQLALRATLLCDVDVNQLSERVGKFSIEESTIEKWVRAHPSYLDASTGLEVANLQLRSSELGNKISFGPLVGYDYGKTSNSASALSDAYVGVQLKWNPQGDKGDAAIQYSELSRNAARDTMTKSYYDLKSRIAGLARQARSQQTIIGVLDKSVKNLEELLRALEIQKKLGSADSLNFTNSFLNKIDALHARFDAWAQIHKITFELKEYSQLAQAQ